MWYFAAKWDDFGPDTWVYRTNYIDESDYTKYVYSFYFIITIITTVGYGDMPANTSNEKLIVMLVMIIGIIAFSFSIGSLSSALSNLDTRAAKLKAKSFELNSIRKKYKMSSDLYNRLFKALKFEIEQDEDIEEFLETLPQYLKAELLLVINKEIISIIPYFQSKDESFCALTASFLQSSKTYSRDFIYEVADPIYEIFFLLKGEAGYVVQESDITVVFCKILPGNLFGELDFFYSEPGEAPKGERCFNVKAIHDCELVSLSKESLFEIEKEYENYVAEIFEYANYRSARTIRLFTL